MAVATPTAPLLRIDPRDEPWGIPLGDRAALRQRHDDDQRRWLPRLRELVEPPHPDDRFPAFLLAAPRFAALRRAIGDARDRRELDTATADQLQRFVDLYSDYLDRDEPTASNGR